MMALSEVKISEGGRREPTGGFGIGWLMRGCLYNGKVFTLQ